MKKWEVKTIAIIHPEGHFSFGHNKQLQFKAELKLHKEEQVRIIVMPYDPKKEAEELRTIQQNKYYHVLLDIICDHTGDNHMDMHRNLTRELLGRPYIYKDKEVIEVPSTISLSPKLFGDYLEKVFKFASEEYGLVLPESKKYYD